MEFTPKPTREVTEDLAVEDLVIRMDLRRLVDEYAIAADGFENERYAGLFTEDATFTATAAGATEPFITAHGRAEIARVPDANRVFEQTFHDVANHVVEIDGDRATGVVYCLGRHLLPASESGVQEALVLPVRYYDEYVKTDAGWRFASRRIQFTWIERATVDPAALAAWVGAPEETV
jgi:SnoaL-like domain